MIGAARFMTGYTDSIATFPDTLSKHRLVEAFKHVFSIRMSMSDPAFSNVTHDAAKDMVSGDYMDSVSGNVAMLSVYPVIKRAAPITAAPYVYKEYGIIMWCHEKKATNE